MLLTRSPLSPYTSTEFTFDLHVLGTPPAFILSQDQTLRIIPQQTSSNVHLVSTVEPITLASSCHSSVVKVLPVIQTNKNRHPWDAGGDAKFCRWDYHLAGRFYQTCFSSLVVSELSTLPVDEFIPECNINIAYRNSNLTYN